MPVRVTRSVQTVAGAIARLPSARRTSSIVTPPASMSAPSTMSPAAPAKQSKYRTFTTCRLYPPLPRPSRDVSRFHHRVVRLVGQDEMVHHVDAHDVTGVHHAERQIEVVGAWRSVSRRMVMKQDDRRGRRSCGLSEHLAWMNDRAVERTNREQLDPDDTIL